MRNAQNEAASQGGLLSHEEMGRIQRLMTRMLGEVGVFVEGPEMVGAAGKLDHAKAQFFRAMRNNMPQVAVWSPIPLDDKRPSGGKVHDITRFGKIEFK